MRKSAFNSRLSQRVAVLYLATALFGTASSGAEPNYEHGISFFHELKYPADFSHFDYINPDAPKGGVLVQSTQSDFNTLSLITDQSVTAPGVNWIYDSLVSYRSEEMSSFYGWLADGLSVADDKRTLFIRLHPRARWHDGLPITARDVKFTLELIQSSIRFRGFLSWVRSVEILGEREIALRLDSQLTVSNIFPLSWFPILPAHYWEERDPARASLEPPLGSGPYQVAEVRQGRHVRYERVPDYWGRDIAVNKGRFNFDQIRYEVYRDATVAREAFRKGLFDTWMEPDIRYWATGYDIPARDKGWLVMDHLDHREEIGINRVIALNNRRDRFKDPRIREALTLAVDFEWENRVLRFGLLDRALSNFSGEPSLEAQGLPGEGELALLAPFRDQLPKRLFTTNHRFPMAGGTTIPRRRRSRSADRVTRLLRWIHGNHSTSARLSSAVSLDPFAERIVDPRLPAPATRLEVINHILRQPDRRRHLGAGQRAGGHDGPQPCRTSPARARRKVGGGIRIKILAGRACVPVHWPSSC